MTQSLANVPIRFRPLRSGDLPLLHKWLNSPHVSRWWFMENGKRNPTLEEVREQWLRRIDHIEHVDCFMVLIQRKPIAYIQWYRVSDFAESKALINHSDNMAGMDVFIGESDYLNKGFGTTLIRKFLEEIIFKVPGIERCMIDPEPENTPAIRAYEKVGFKYSHTAWDAKYRVHAYIMFVSRDNILFPS